ncbi:MAG: OmpA family protein [Bacteroidota bacterium]
MKKALFYVIVFCLANIAALSQVEKYELFTVQPKLGFGFNKYSADFNNFEGAADCGRFKDGSGSGLFFGALFERSLDTKKSVGLALNYINRSGILSIDYIYPLRNPDNTITKAKIKDKIDAQLSYLEISPSFVYSLTDEFINAPLRAIGSLRFGLPLEKTFEQYEEIVSPSGAVFVDNGIRRKRRDIASGDIKSINNLVFGISLGLENNLKIGNNTFFTQTLSFDYNFNNVTSDADWKVLGVRLDLGLRYTLFRTVEHPKPAPPPPAEIDIYVEPPKEPFVDIRQKKFDGKVFVGNELLATSPLVNALFFARNSDKIPGYYVDALPASINYFVSSPVELHRYVLPRIVEIVKHNPKARITVEGATSGPANEPEGLELARRRAENVKSRLVSLGVPESIIKTSARVSPRFPSNQDFPEGIDENQRVDILVSNAPLQEYVDLQKYSEIDGKISLLIAAENINKSEILNITDSFTNSEIQFSGSGLVEIPVKKRLDDLEDKVLSYSIKLNDNTFFVFKDTLAVSRLPREVIELNLNNFEAILRFDYNSSELSEDNKGLLRQLSEKLPANSTILILGSADALGTAERNARLSRERAANTEQFIRSIVGNKFKIETGISEEKFDETTPQGRFLNRSIRIRVK